MDGELYSRFRPIAAIKKETWMTTGLHLLYPDQARQIVVDHFNGSRDPSDSDRYQLKMEDVYVVWFCKTLQNWKALVSTILPDLTYYEVTFNGNEQVVYLDVYTKTLNREIPVAMIQRTEMGPDLGGLADLPKEKRYGGKKLPNLMGSGVPDQPAPYRTPYD